MTIVSLVLGIIALLASLFKEIGLVALFMHGGLSQPFVMSAFRF